MSQIKSVATENAPKALGPYSQAIRCGDFMFLSGQIPLDPKTGNMVGENIEQQTEQVLKNIKAVLESQELSFKNVVKTTVFLANMEDFAKFNAVYEKHLTAPFPARSTFQVAKLPKAALIEIESVAYLGK